MADDFMSESTCRHADIFIREQGVTTIPIELTSMCQRLDIGLRPMTDGDSPSGMLIHERGTFVIAYAANSGNEGFERFCIAHELGHYHLPGHVDALFKTGTVHESRAGFVSDSKYEREADNFAASLLMPKGLFKKAMASADSGIAAIQRLSSQFTTSLLATSIRFTNLSDDPIAIIVSTKNVIDYCFMSPSFKEIKGLNWIRKHSILPRSTATFNFNQDPEQIATGQIIEDTSDLSEWFGSEKEIKVNEDVVGLGKSGQTLTLLYGIELPDEDDIGDDELMESWTPRFRR
jgi:hypothetical protein